jgi:proteasome lid subunit RPN8/RPN11
MSYTVYKVQIKKSTLASFRRRAIRSKKEILAYLVGYVSDNIFVVIEVAYTKKYEISTPENVKWFDKDYYKVLADAQKQDLDIIGDIHSHPNCDAIMSEADYNGTALGNVCGICAVYKTPKNNNRSLIRFWVKNSALCCDLEYLQE